jgi:hypothetical protein
MLLLEKPSQPSFLPFVECTKVRLPHPVGKLLQGEFRFLPAEWGLAFGPAQVQRIVTLIICIVLVIGNLHQWRQIYNPCNVSPPQVRSRQISFRWVANQGLPGAPSRCPGAVEKEEVGGMTGLFWGGAPGDDGPYAVNCWGGNS